MSIKDKDKKMLFGIGIVFLFLVSVGISYKYFSSTITNKDVKEQVVETGTLEASYEIFWQELNNEIINDEMVMSATCERLNSDCEYNENVSLKGMFNDNSVTGIPDT